MEQNISAYMTEAPDVVKRHVEHIVQEQSAEQLQQVSLRDLREKKKETDKAIETIQARINYMRVKEESALKKVFNVRKRVTDIQRARKTHHQLRQMQEQARRREQQQLAKKNQFNKLLKEHLECNKKIVFALLSEKVKEDTRKLKRRHQDLSVTARRQKESVDQENMEKANRVRMEHIALQEKKKMFFLEKLRNVKDLKEDKLKNQLKLKEHHDLKIQQLEQKQAQLLERLTVSEKFRLRCEEQYLKAREKYHSFYQNTVLTSRRNSLKQSKYSGPASRQQHSDDTKCNIFIS